MKQQIKKYFGFCNHCRMERELQLLKKNEGIVFAAQRRGLQCKMCCSMDIEPSRVRLEIS